MPYKTGEPTNAKISCEQCKNLINEYQNYFECDVCFKKYHTKCCNLFGQHIQRAASEKEFICKLCKSNDATPTGKEVTPKRKASNNDDIPHSNANKKVNIEHSCDTKFDKIMDCLTDMKNSNTILQIAIQEIKDNQAFISNQFDHLNNQFKTINKDYVEIKKDIAHGKIVQNEHFKMISEMDADIDDIKQRDLSNNIIITNLPNNIDITETFSNILNLLNANATMNDIADIKLIPKKIDNNSSTINKARNNSVMLVKFKNLYDKNDFMNKKKTKGVFLQKRLDLIHQLINKFLYVIMSPHIK